MPVKTGYPKPHLIDLNRIGDLETGYITVPSPNQLPFEVKRFFWTYFTPESIVRGRHAHHKTEQILIAVSGRIIVVTEIEDEVMTFVLEKPNVGLYVPPNAWHTMQYSHNAVQFAFTSTFYDADDYIRDYNVFKKVWNKTS
jgi:dTDP-4-dehydrorhamnose 3,5-epimerase-like enzyme